MLQINKAEQREEKGGDTEHRPTSNDSESGRELGEELSPNRTADLKVRGKSQ